MVSNSAVVLALALNVIAFFYLKAWRPVVDLVKWFRLSRQIRAMRVAGLLMLLFMVAPVHAQTAKTTAKVDSWAWNAQTGVVRDGDWTATESVLRSQGYSRGEDGLIYKIEPQDITGYPALDNALRYVWNNCGKLIVVFLLLAAASMLNSKLKADNECHGDVLRREAAERWEEENDDDSMHNPFNSPEGMQPTTQYVPVRTRR